MKGAVEAVSGGWGWLGLGAGQMEGEDFAGGSGDV